MVKTNSLCVINYSGGGPWYLYSNKAVAAAVKAGVVVVVSAVNDNHDACYNSPGSATQAITVGGTMSSDTVRKSYV